MKTSVVFALLTVVVAPLSLTQTSPEVLWSGQAQCQITMQNAGYSHQETQTWAITAGAPTQQGAMQVYPGTWSVSGQGTTQKTLGTQKLAGQWTSTVPQASAQIAVFIRASDNRLIIKPWHTQLHVPGAIAVVKQLAVAGAALTQTTVTSDAYEWPFPAVEDVPASTNVSGSGSTVVAGIYMPMQSAGTNGTATCTWQFTQGVPAAGSQGQLLPSARQMKLSVLGSPADPPPPPPPATPTPTLQVEPNTGAAGSQSLTVTLTGNLTHFVQGQSSLWIGPGGVFSGMDEVSFTVNSPTSATAVINIDPYGAASPIDFMVMTGTEIVHVPFSITSSASTPASHPIPVMLNPNRAQQGQSLAITVQGYGTHFVNGVTRINVLGGQATLTVTSRTLATGTLSLSEFAQTGELLYSIETGPESGLTLPFTVSPTPDSYGHSMGQASYFWLDLNNPRIINGKLASPGGEDWFQFDGNGTFLTITLRNDHSPSSQFLGDIVTGFGGGPVPVVTYAGTTVTQKVNFPAGTQVYLRIHAAAWSLMFPQYSVAITMS